ncbi:hypothetical protein Taro_044625 [Colocasia esculenta]|uniref:Uncharacterized protein n=1 Tax=Colocasia esculenta TaxID=4460 RepID=A0A843WUI1_COLES|nr:hypothetical protein [Colocasia esculenta]
MSRDLHMAAYYLHPAFHYAMELSYDDDLTAAFTRIVEMLSRNVIAADEELSGLGVLRSHPPLLVGTALTAGEYELDKEVDDPEDSPHPNTFLAKAVEVAEEEEGEHGDVGQPHSSQFRAEAEDEVDLLGDLRMERAMPSRDGANLDDDVDF